MIKELTLENFQAHKKLVVQIDPRVTVIVGDTDVGKSAVIRALRWALQNTPGGADFIRYGAKTAVVSVDVDDQIIVRSRGKTENLYFLNGDEFVAFGNGVPQRVKDLLRVEDINFQSQHDAPFWFSESAGEVSRRLNQIIDLSIIDNVMGEVAGRLRKFRTEAEICEERVHKAKTLVKELAYVEELNAALVKLEALEAAHAEAANRTKALRSGLEGVRGYSQAAKLARQRTVEGRDLLVLADSAIAKHERAEKLRDGIQHLVSLKKRKDMKVPSLKELDKLKKEYETTAERRSTLADTLENLRELWKNRRDTKAQAEKVHTILHDKMDGFCPICHQAMPKS